MNFLYFDVINGFWQKEGELLSDEELSRVFHDNLEVVRFRGNQFERCMVSRVREGKELKYEADWERI